ncbi:alcohol dehydrogenase catalytic domain-containing protein [Caldichromatium japonicum]|uniref:Alcohol dehydrogenase catalytic domain-containing protein n=1 Tax=Caldichromatium japonicum TaxID=2699430 RepID=A0A6G7VFL1_9GAMM|nr:alcohol dehydrogenase catalytic domain-containing protein [Caldichromatium japonicum]QIK38690.1 alcohol dehydrogenase catalytic domain-containing protein [Caldichromatium japonicum]
MTTPLNAELPLLEALAVVFEQPEQLALKRLPLDPPGPADVVVDIEWSGISTGTERLLWQGTMPPFPGMGYPLVPGYESVGRVIHAGPEAGLAVGERVFVPGARCYGEVRGLFGGAASRVVAPAARVFPVPESLDEQAVLLTLAATAYHALVPPAEAPVHAALRTEGNQGAGERTETVRTETDTIPPLELIVGHGVLGRLLARIASLSDGPPPIVWETNPIRRSGAEGLGYTVIAPEDDPRRDYRSICDMSGDHRILNTLIARLARGGELILGGFYHEPLCFDFPPAFMRELRLRIAAEFQHLDLAAVQDLIAFGRLSLAGLITHRLPATEAEQAYRTAFTDPGCLKMILDWRTCA